MDRTVAHPAFPQTKWTLVLAMRDGPPNTRSRKALAELCGDYWYPLYSYARRAGASAEDFTQGFFAYLLERDLFASADREVGRLRSFLITVFQRYMRDCRERDATQKRGGREQVLSLDAMSAEDRFQHEPPAEGTPESAFEKLWAHASLEAALKRLEVEEDQAGRGTQFRGLRVFLVLNAAAEPGYAEVAAELGLSADAARQAVSRLRKRFRVHLRAQIAETLDDPTEAQLQEELAALRAALEG